MSRRPERLKDAHSRCAVQLPMKHWLTFRSTKKWRLLKAAKQFEANSVSRLVQEDAVQFFIAARQPPFSPVRERFVERVLIHHLSEPNSSSKVRPFGFRLVPRTVPKNRFWRFSFGRRKRLRIEGLQSIRSAHKKGGVVLSAYHATQGRRIVQTSMYTQVSWGGSPCSQKF